MPAATALVAEAYDIMTDQGEEAFRQRSEIQRDLGRLEGKVDALLGSVSSLAQALVRSDAERDHLAGEVMALERKHGAAISTLKDTQSEELSKVKAKLYYIAGAIAAGGVGAGAAAAKIFGSLLH